MADEQAPTPSTPSKRAPKREDPPPRPVDQLVTRGLLDRQDPNKHYVWVSEVTDPTFNVGHYRMLGYKVAQYDPDEAQPLFGYEEFKQGDPVKTSGMVLMECPLERKQARDQKGWDEATRLQDRIRGKELDPLTAEEQAKFRGIKSVRTEQDDRARWNF